MRREKLKWWSHKSESTDARHGDGVARSSVEGSVMELERRGYIVLLIQQDNQNWEDSVGESKAIPVWERLNDRSGMNREIHVPLPEGLAVKFLRATRPINRLGWQRGCQSCRRCRSAGGKSDE
jgi:hypothetical protein